MITNTIEQQQNISTPMEALRTPTGWLRSLNIAVLMFFITTSYAPSALAIKNDIGRNSQPVSHDYEAMDQYAAKLSLMKTNFLRAEELYVNGDSDLVGKVADLDNAIENGGSLFRDSESWEEVLQRAMSLKADVLTLHEETESDFDATEEWIENSQFSPVIMERHKQAFKEYSTQYNEFSDLVNALSRSKDEETKISNLRKLNSFLKSVKFERTESEFKPEELPWTQPSLENLRKPATSSEEYLKDSSLSSTEGGVDDSFKGFSLLSFIVPEAHAQAIPPTSGNELAETPDVQLTTLILKTAESLDNDPVKIYEWVRNNIEFIPTYGSIQGAERTLKSGKGNAFDTSSLLIALYRAAGIPARYAYGTIEVPADKVQNWVGGVNTPSAAQQLLGQGGIPTKGIVSGGKIGSIQLEHIWVEAWVDYFPSRGAKNIEGDSWVALDPSFKQYEYVEGNFDFDNVQFQGKALLEASTKDFSWGPESHTPEFDTAVSNYIEAIEQFAADKELGELFGQKKLIKKEYGILASGLPNKLVARLDTYSEIPDRLRHKVRYQLLDEFGGSTGLRYESSLPELSGKSLSTGFRPATEEDKAVLTSLLPTGTDASVDDLPSRYSSYLVRLTSKFFVDGQEVASSGSFRMGSDVKHRTSLYSPSNGWVSRENTGVVGEYRAIGIDAAGTDSADFEDIVEKMEVLVHDLDEDPNSDQSQIIETIAQLGIQTYFGLSNQSARYQGLHSGVVEYRYPSFGYFHTNVSATYSFGIPRFAEFSGVTLDVPLVRSISAHEDNDSQQLLDYRLQQGLGLSYLENIVPELVFDGTQGSDIEGISAARALDLALEQGQQVYVLTQANSTELNNVTIDSAARSNIRNALAVGKEVTVHERPVSVRNWTGSGYLVLDPQVGDGGYLISGGQNGGFASLDADDLLGILSLGIDFIPGVGTAKGIIELITGVDMITGEPINRWLVGFATAASLIGAGGIVKALGKGSKNAVKSATKITTGSNEVYVNINKATGKIDYVGITNNFARRKGEQVANGRDITKFLGGNLSSLSRSDAKAVEQALIVRFGGPVGRDGSNTTTQLTNIINSVSPNRADYDAIIARGEEILSAAGL